MPTIFIENQPYDVPDGQNLLRACLGLGFDIPYFCWHPALHSVGACRLCAVKQSKDEQDTRGRIVMSCMTPVQDGLRISIDDPQARQFRASVLEWLMINHPHDCPVCDEGGECHLQDMTVLTGHVRRRYRFTKRTYRNQDLGPLVNHEMNRCIQCFRCVRFYRDYAGGRDLDLFGSHDHVYFGRFEDGALESEFAGNLVEICPTGVFTDKTLKKHYTRKWDLQTAPSLCVHCGLGCNTIAGERYGSLRRIRNRFNGAVNGYFLCDRGRYGYEFVNSGQRLRRVLVRSGKELMPAPPEEPLRQLAEMAAAGQVIGIGSPRASLEANFLLRSLVGPDRFYSGMSGTDHRLVAAAIDILNRTPCRLPSLQEAARADAVLILGEDVANTAPLLGLALRQAVRNKPLEQVREIPLWDDHGVREYLQDEKGPFFSATPAATRLDELAASAFHAPPEELARLGFMIAREIDPQAPVPAGGRSTVARRLGRAVSTLVRDEMEQRCRGRSLLRETAHPLICWIEKQAGRLPRPRPAAGHPLARRLARALGLLLSRSLTEPDSRPEMEKEEDSLLRRLVRAFLDADDQATIARHPLGRLLARSLEMVTAEALEWNAPDPVDAATQQPLAARIGRALLAARRPLVISGTGAASELVLQAAANVTLALQRAGRDPGLFLTMPEANSMGAGLMQGKELQEALLPRKTGRTAVLVLENDLYRRAAPAVIDRLLQDSRLAVLDHCWNRTAARADVLLPAAAWAEGTGTLVNNEGRSQRFFQVYAPAGDIRESWRWLAALLALKEPSRAAGLQSGQQVLAALAHELPVFRPALEAAPGPDFRMLGRKIPRQPHRYSGRTAMHANRTIHEPRAPADPGSPFAFSMEGGEGRPPASLVPRYWWPGWNSVQALQKFQQERGSLLEIAPAGRRLLEPDASRSADYFRFRSEAPRPGPDEWLLVPLYLVFGSEELSRLAPAIRELAPEPYLALHPADARRLGVEEGREAELTVAGQILRLPVRLDGSLSPATAGLPVGLPGLESIPFPALAGIGAAHD